MVAGNLLSLRWGFVPRASFHLCVWSRSPQKWGHLISGRASQWNKSGGSDLIWKYFSKRMKIEVSAETIIHWDSEYLWTIYFICFGENQHIEHSFDIIWCRKINTWREIRRRRMWFVSMGPWIISALDHIRLSPQQIFNLVNCD